MDNYAVKDAFGETHEVGADDYEVDEDGDLVMFAENEDGDLVEIGRFPHYTAVVLLAEDETEEDEDEDEVNAE